MKRKYNAESSTWFLKCFLSFPVNAMKFLSLAKYVIDILTLINCLNLLLIVGTQSNKLSFFTYRTVS